MTTCPLATQRHYGRTSGGDAVPARRLSATVEPGGLAKCAWRERARRTSRIVRPVQGGWNGIHDKNIGRQIQRMRRVASTADGSSATSLADYRLGSVSCYFKVCHPEFDLGSSELSKGMYMDLDLWELVTAHLASDGSGAISFNKDLRYLNNTEFIGLVREGWIGSRGVTTKTIHDYVMRTLRSRHSVTLAAAAE